jgi:hypothetical protein
MSTDRTSDDPDQQKIDPKHGTQQRPCTSVSNIASPDESNMCVPASCTGRASTRHGSDPGANKKSLCVCGRQRLSLCTPHRAGRPGCLPVRARSGNPCRASRRGSVGGDGCQSPPCMCRANWDPCPRAAWAVGCAAPLQRTSAPPPAARSSGTGTGRPVGVGTLGSARSDSELLVVHATEGRASHTTTEYVYSVDW